MGLFSNDIWSKPGKGVDKDEPQKNAFFHFWELVGRKFFRLVAFNVFYFICLLPVIVAVYGVFYTWLAAISGVGADEAVSLPVLPGMLSLLYTYVPGVLHIPLLIISLLIYGPATMGLTYILRNFVREEHAWTSDFFSRALSNWKQGLFFGILDIIAAFIMYVNWNYSALSGEEVGAFAIVIRGVTTVLFIYYLFMRNYFYQLAVTVDLNVRQIIKNAAIFGIVGLGRNFLALICVVAIVVVSTMLHSLVELLAVPLIMFSLAGFAAVYCTYPITDKYIVQPALAEERKNEERIGFDDLEPAVLPPELGGPGAGALGPRDAAERSAAPVKPEDAPADAAPGSAETEKVEGETPSAKEDKPADFDSSETKDENA